AARSSGAVVGDRRIDELDVAVPGAEATPVRSGNVSAERRAVDEETACALREVNASRLARRPVPGDRARPDRRAPVAIEIPSSGERGPIARDRAALDRDAVVSELAG